MVLLLTLTWVFLGEEHLNLDSICWIKPFKFLIICSEIPNSLSSIELV